MKRLSYIFFILFIVPCFALAFDFTFYEDVESETKNLDWPISNCYVGNSGTMYWNSTGSDNCSRIVENSDDTGIAARYGNQYLTMYCDLAATWGAYDAPERTGWLFGAENEWTGCNRPNYNDDTEYWYGWSIYIQSDYVTETTNTDHMVMQFKNSTTIIYALYFGDTLNWHARRLYNDITTYPIYNEDWEDEKGTWVDFVIHVVWHNTDDADAIFEVWKSGTELESVSGSNTLPTGQSSPYFNLVLYETNISTEGWYDIITTPPGTSRWREFGLDEIRVTEGAIGTYNYCDVAPPIWAETPSISHPSEGETNLGTTFNASFTDFTAHRVDLQGCYPAYKMEVEVDEDGGDWSTLVFDSDTGGAKDSSNTISVTGLSDSTTYQMRVRHSSYNSDTTTQYWGEWSTVIDFSTDLPPDPEPSLSLGGLEVGGNTALETDGNTDLAIP